MRSRALIVILGAALAASVPFGHTKANSVSTRPVVAVPARPFGHQPFQRAGATMRGTKMQGARGTVRQSATSLQLPDIAFSPATVSPPTQCGGEVSNANADAHWFGLYHSTSYTAFHRVTGYGQCASWTPSGANSARFLYEGSIFDSADNASRAWVDGKARVSTFNQAVQQDCSNWPGIGTTCAAISFVLNDGNFAWFHIIQYGPCLLENYASFSSDLYTANGDQLNRTISAMDVAAVSQARRACSVTAFTLAGVRILIDSGDHHAVTRVRVGTPLRLAIFYHLTSAPANTQIVAHFSLTENSRVVFNQQSPAHAPWGPAGQDYVDYLKYTPSTSGSFIAQGELVINNQQAADSTRFTIIPRAVSLTYLSLRTLNARSQPQQTFRSGEQIYLNAQYSAKGILTTAPIAFSLTLQIPGQRGGWQALSNTETTRQSTSAGQHAYVRNFSLSFKTYNRVRIILAIILGRQSQTRSQVIYKQK